MSQKRFVDRSTLKPNVVAGSGGTVEHCETTMLERNQSRHRALNELGSPPPGAGTGRSRSDSLGNDSSSGIRRTRSSTGGFGYTSRQTSSLASAPDARRPTDSSPLLGKQQNNISSVNSIPSILEYYNSGFADNTRNEDSQSTIRFQVVIWHVGQIDMVQGRVPVTFRVTIFWNALPDDLDTPTDEAVSQTGSQKGQYAWRMLGRQQAYQTDVKDIPVTTVDVPPVSILNAVTFETIGDPEICQLREDSRLMQWSCMYRAMLFQEHWEVDNFPHDEHEISLRLAVLAHRQSGSQWDRHVWKLALATADDSQGSLRVPHGLAMDHLAIPEFLYNRSEGLKFEFTPLDHGPGGGTVKRDTCLEVKLKVLRDSSYYDRNIMPLLGMLNVVAISITSLDGDDFFERALLALDIAFVEIGMRLTVDSKLPTASYQIKMQRILNEYFFVLLFLVLESLLVYELRKRHFDLAYTDTVDCFAALAVVVHNVYTLFVYYYDARRVRKRVLNISSSREKRKIPL